MSEIEATFLQAFLSGFVGGSLAAGAFVLLLRLL